MEKKNTKGIVKKKADVKEETKTREKKEDKTEIKKALILSFRRGRHTQTMNQFLLEISDIDTHAKASQYIGRRVVWTSPGKLKKQIFGKITKTHGNNGVLRARFSRGLPGTAIRTEVQII